MKKLMMIMLGCWLSHACIQAYDVNSVSIRNSNGFMSPNVIRLGSPDKTSINFDILGEEPLYLKYRLLHLNADGSPSRLMESEYIGGFNEAKVEDYAYSSNTFIHYVNYNIEIPNPEMPLLTSGEYVMQVFQENEPDDIILVVPFSVSEDTAIVNGFVTSRTDKGFNSFYQQLEIEVETPQNKQLNPYQDLIVTVVQNNRPETLRVLEHPIRVESGKVIYDHTPDLIFEANNEYRRFETVRADYPGMNVDSVTFETTNWHAWLSKDEARMESSYIYDNTQHGRFMIDELNATDPDLGADYIAVHFTLDAPQISDGSIYIDGDFTGHQFNETNLMRYDWKDGLYHAAMLLKQGSYNYQYVVVPENLSGAYPSPIEGNKYETRNEYLVRVYLREPGSRGDRLIGHTVLQVN